MGAANFEDRVCVPKATTDDDAFQGAVSDARNEHGHGGYTGTLAEKSSFVMIHRARSEENAWRIVNAMMTYEGTLIYREDMRAIPNDKWGPAAAVRFPIDKENDGLIFFGMASS